MSTLFDQDNRAVSEEIDGCRYFTNGHWMIALTRNELVPPIRETKMGPYRAALKGKELQYIGTDSLGNAAWRETSGAFVVILDARYVELLGLKGKTLRTTGDRQPVAFFNGAKHLGWIMPRTGMSQFNLDGLMEAADAD